MEDDRGGFKLRERRWRILGNVTRNNGQKVNSSQADSERTLMKMDTYLQKIRNVILQGNFKFD
jgi:hypothetical protein